MIGIREIIDDLKQYFDIYDLLIGVGGFLLVIAFLAVVSQLSGVQIEVQLAAPLAIAIFTGVYAVAAVKDWRTGDLRPRDIPTVRRDYQFNENSGDYELGLRNFGNSVALYLRVLAMMEPEGPTLIIDEEDPPLHLPEGEFTTLTKDVFTDLSNPDSDFYDRKNSRRLELYYTFESTSGRQFPQSQDKPCEKDLEEVVNDADAPRIASLDEIRNHNT